MEITVLWMEAMTQVQEAKAVILLCPHMTFLDAYTTSPVIGDSYITPNYLIVFMSLSRRVSLSLLHI